MKRMERINHDAMIVVLISMMVAMCGGLAYAQPYIVRKSSLTTGVGWICFVLATGLALLAIHLRRERIMFKRTLGFPAPSSADDWKHKKLTQVEAARVMEALERARATAEYNEELFFELGGYALHSLEDSLQTKDELDKKVRLARKQHLQCHGFLEQYDYERPGKREYQRFKPALSRKAGGPLDTLEIPLAAGMGGVK